MSQTIPVDQSAWSQSRRVHIRGTDVDVFPSPYDIPRSMTVECSDDGKPVTITVQYLASDDPVGTIKLSEGVFANVGRKTRRLYGLRFDIEQVGGLTVGIAGRLTKAISDAIDKLSADPAGSHRKFNYAVIKTVLTDACPLTFGRLEEVGRLRS